MLSSRVGAALRKARTEQGLSRAALAAQCGVSVRLLAELERGERPNVSLETAHLLLRAVGISLEPREMKTEKQAQAERRAIRQATWTGVITTRTAMHEPPAPATITARLAAVTQASVLAHALAREVERVAERKSSSVSGRVASPPTKRGQGSRSR